MSNSVCRVCLKNDQTLYDIFELLVVNEEESQIPFHEMLGFCCNITVTNNLPQSICTVCIEGCSKAYNFIKLFHKNNITFTRLYDDKVKKELDDLNDVKVKIENPVISNEITENPSSTVENTAQPKKKTKSLKINPIQLQSKSTKKVNISDKKDEIDKSRQRHVCPVCEETFFHYSYFVNHIKIHVFKFNCRLCDAEFKNSTEFQQHYFRYHYNFCNICQKSFMSRKDHHYHKMMKHRHLVKRRVFKTPRTGKIQRSISEFMMHKCPNCNFSSKYFSRYDVHMHEKHKDDQTTCIDCNETFPNGGDFLYHYVRRHYNFCNICQVGFEQRDSFNRHQREHVEKGCFEMVNDFDCPKCNIKCSFFNDFVKHLYENHKGSVTCNICQKKTKSISFFIAHYKAEHRIKCEKCGGYCTTQEQFDAHINKSIIMEKDKKGEKCISEINENQSCASPPVIEFTKPKHTCPICKMEFRYIAEYRLHIRNTHIDYDNSTPVQCNYCDEICQNLPSFFSHYQNEHYIQCDHCKKFYMNKNMLKRHKCSPSIKTRKKTVNVEKMCPTCGKWYKGSLKKHEELHQIELKYKCELCEMMFSKYDQMRYHRLKKHNLMRFLCTHCGKRFVNKTQFETHSLAHLGIKRYSCDKCGQKFVLKRSQVNHINYNLCGKRRGRAAKKRN